MTTAAERALQQATWPGNIRELRNVIERACLLSEGRILSEREILAAMTTSAGPPPPEVAAPDSRADADRPPDDLLSSAERTQIGRVLKQAGGNKTEAARLLGISRRSLYRWMDRLNLVGPRPRTPGDRCE